MQIFLFICPTLATCMESRPARCAFQLSHSTISISGMSHAHNGTQRHTQLIWPSEPTNWVQSQVRLLVEKRRGHPVTTHLVNSISLSFSLLTAAQSNPHTIFTAFSRSDLRCRQASVRWQTHSSALLRIAKEKNTLTRCICILARAS